jgi:hypothetical protein
MNFAILHIGELCIKSTDRHEVVGLDQTYRAIGQLS